MERSVGQQIDELKIEQQLLADQMNRIEASIEEVSEKINNLESEINSSSSGAANIYSGNTIDDILARQKQKQVPSKR